MHNRLLQCVYFKLTVNKTSKRLNIIKTCIFYKIDQPLTKMLAGVCLIFLVRGTRLCTAQTNALSFTRLITLQKQKAQVVVI